MQAIIEHYFKERLTLSPGDGAPPELRHAIDETLSLLDSGKLRVAAHIENEWVVDQWLKKLSYWPLDSIPIKSLRWAVTLLATIKFP